MKIFRFFNVTSTNDVAFDMLYNGECPIFAVSAETQTNGRGYHGHKWISTKGNLHISFALDVSDHLISSLNIIPQCLALRFCQLIRPLLNLGVKWPNDIFYKMKKIGGILLETKFNNMQLQYAALGVGVNIFSIPDVNIAGYKVGALSEYSTKISHAFVESTLVQALEDILSWLLTGKLKNFLKQYWKKYDIFYEHSILVESQGCRFYGTNKGVEDTGALVLYDKDGKKYCFNSANAQIIIDCY